MVSRSKHFCKNFVELDVEPLLNAVLNTHPSALAAAKSALRDLDLKVHLQEQWTGSAKVTVEASQESSIKDIPEELQG